MATEMLNGSPSTDRHDILAPSPRVEERARVLKHDDTFAVFNHFGDIRPVGLSEEGLYFEGTRHLSRLTLAIAGHGLLLLSSTVRKDNGFLTVDLTNPDIDFGQGDCLPRDQVHIFRGSFLYSQGCYTRIRLRNYHDRVVRIPLEFAFEADFADVFEVRGERRPQRGRLLDPECTGDTVTIAYEGLDSVVRRTTLHFTPTPDSVSPTGAGFTITLEPAEERNLYFTITCSNDHAAVSSMSFDAALAALGTQFTEAQAGDAHIYTSNEQCNEWLNQSAADLHLMVTRTPHGPYPYAGIPWFSTPFGRDGIITALEFLWVNPDLARGVLAYLARTQAQTHDAERDAEPGKILHETRQGEMAALREIPFGQYYGTVDATPLFVILAGAYYRRTADTDFIQSIWPNIEAALAWMDTAADADGFVQYTRQATHGLASQGWKDSFDSIFHADGQLAEGPIALCEVQAYVFGAKRAAAELAGLLGHTARADTLTAEAERLQGRFEEVFWCEDLGTYALALDGAKQPCRVRASNAGHCLWTGIAGPAHATRVAATLLDAAFCSKWGVRTLGMTEVRYNPMAYHNGSVWPHDNALIAAGLARYGLREHVLRIFTGLFDASLYFDLHRMPELFCGFTQREGEGPTAYPIACAPQSWAAGAVFLLLRSCLGLSIDAPAGRLCFDRPILPAWLEHLTITGLRVGSARADLELHRHETDVSINLLEREGDLDIVITK